MLANKRKCSPIRGNAAQWTSCPLTPENAFLQWTHLLANIRKCVPLTDTNAHQHNIRSVNGHNCSPTTENACLQWTQLLTDNRNACPQWAQLLTDTIKNAILQWTQLLTDTIKNAFIQWTQLLTHNRKMCSLNVHNCSPTPENRSFNRNNTEQLNMGHDCSKLSSVLKYFFIQFVRQK